MSPVLSALGVSILYATQLEHIYVLQLRHMINSFALDHEACRCVGEGLGILFCLKWHTYLIQEHIVPIKYSTWSYVFFWLFYLLHFIPAISVLNHKHLFALIYCSI